MAAGKTAALIAGACALGAISAGARPVQVTDLRAFGHHLGLAFQIVDDLLGIWGDSRTTGKPAGADLRSRKKSLPVVAALASGTRAGDDLAVLYHRNGPLTDAELAQTARLIEEAGGREWAEREADRQRRHASRHLAAAALDLDGARVLLSLADLVTHRDR
jgi:geranylgeranyl diphosphate synthase type I